VLAPLRVSVVVFAVAVDCAVVVVSVAVVDGVVYVAVDCAVVVVSVAVVDSVVSDAVDEDDAVAEDVADLGIVAAVVVDVDVAVGVVVVDVAVVDFDSIVAVAVGVAVGDSLDLSPHGCLRRFALGSFPLGLRWLLALGSAPFDWWRLLAPALPSF